MENEHIDDIIRRTLKRPTLTGHNVAMRDFYDEINETIKNKNKHKNKDIEEIKDFKEMNIYEQTTTATTEDQTGAEEEDNLYVIPEFSNVLIDDLNNDNDIIYNKHYKEETYKNEALFYINYTEKGRTVKLLAFGYKPEGYKHMGNLGNMYFVSNTYFVLMRCEPFNMEQFYKLTNIMYCFNN